MIVMRKPKCSVLHINRSIFDEMTGAQLKNNASLTFPPVLDLTKWSVGRSRTVIVLDDVQDKQEPRIVCGMREERECAVRRPCL